MNLRQLEYIVAIADEKNMRRAAEKLFVTQSSLSQTLQKTESALGCQLFFRTPKEMLLTPEGEIYVNGARQIMEIRENVYRQIQVKLEPKIRSYNIGISAHESFEYFMQASARFSELHKNVELYAVEGTYKALTEKLQSNNLDLIIVSWDSVSDTYFHYKIIKKEEILLMVPKNHPINEKVSRGYLSWDLLRHEKLILPPQDTTLRSIADKTFKRMSFSPHVAYEINNTKNTFRMVKERNVLGFLPQFLCEQSDDLNFYRLNPPFLRYHLILFNPAIENDLLMKDFIKILQEFAE